MAGSRTPLQPPSAEAGCAPMHAQYLYNLEVYGHKQYTRRDQAQLQAAQKSVEARVASGELGPLSPLE